MSDWGIEVSGLDDAVETIDDLEQRWDGDTLYVAGPTVEYAVYQELGTRDIDPRPFVRPAAERVQSAPREHAEAVLSGPITSEADLVRGVALAVQNEAKQIADAKDIRDTGALIASISIAEVS